MNARATLSLLALILLVTAGIWTTTPSKGTRHSFGEATDADTTARGTLLLIGNPDSSSVFPGGARYFSMSMQPSGLQALYLDSLLIVYRTNGGKRIADTVVVPYSTTLNWQFDRQIDTLEVFSIGWINAAKRYCMEVVN